MKAMIKLLLMAVAVLVISASCEHKELCRNHLEHASRYHIYVDPSYDLDWQYAFASTTPDWSEQWNSDFGFSYDSLRPNKPTGLRVLTNNIETGESNQLNISADGGRVYFSGPRNSLLLYNNDTEYIIFNDLSTQTAATATTRTRTRSTYVGNEYSSEAKENTVSPPDMLFARYIKECILEKQLNPDTVPVELIPLVYTYLVRYEVTYGMEYLGLARGALSGKIGRAHV